MGYYYFYIVKLTQTISQIQYILLFNKHFLVFSVCLSSNLSLPILPTYNYNIISLYKLATGR